MDRAISLEARSVDLAIEAPFRLGQSTIDTRAHTITVGGKATRIQPQTLKVLVALHDRSGEVVTRDELIDRCWNGRFVGDDVINRCVSLLRRLAAESGDFEIETVPRSGYRLVETETKPDRRRQWMIVAASLVLAAGLAGWMFLARPPDHSRRDDDPTVGVLPLRVSSNDPLMRDSAAQVRGSISEALNNGGFPVTVIDPSAVRKPDLLVSGSIGRTVDKIELVLEAEETRRGVILFSQHFEADANRSTDLAEQGGAFVASKLAWIGDMMALDRRHPSDPAVTDKLLEQGGEGLQAYEVSRQLVRTAPNSVTANLSLAYFTGFVLGDLPRDQRPAAVALGREAAARALSIAPEFGDSYGPWCALHGGASVAECENWIRKGLRVDPDAPYASFFLSGLLDGVGRVDESLRFAELTLSNDPFNPSKLAREQRLLEESGDTRDADRKFERATRWWPNDRDILWNRVLGMEARGDYAGIARLEATSPNAAPFLDRALIGELFAALQSRDRARGVRACANKQLRPMMQSLCMMVLADLGEFDRAFALARILYPPIIGRNAAENWLDQPDGFALAILSGPGAVMLRRDPRFLAVAKENGLLDYWRSGRLPDFCTKAHEAVCAHIVRERD